MIKARIVSLIGMTLASLVYADSPSHSLTVGEQFSNPLGFHDATPTFSWKLPVGVKKQTAYRIEVRDDTVVWDSGWVESDQTVFVPYGGEALASRQRLQWRVDFRDENGAASGWSETATFELGLLSSNDWNAQWIRPASGYDQEKATVSWLRREFPMAGKIKRARLYVTARGIFEISLNGEKVGNAHFANGWTSYLNRLDTLTYDVTDQLTTGDNRIQAMLGTGWYAGRVGWKHQKGLLGRFPELLLQLEVFYQDGSSEVLVSDESWQGTCDGPIISSDLYDGEHVDARKIPTGWEPVVANPDLGTARLTPKPFAPVRVKHTVSVQSIKEPEPGRFVFDMGQNMVGWAKLNIPVGKDGTVTVRFSEMLNPDGTMHTLNYRSAKSTDTYTAAETGMVSWEPTFTFHGFRYVELSGLPEGTKPDKSWLSGMVLYTDLERIGSFESSHEKLNQLQRNIVWGQRGNFLDIPTDCPQRDERLGWTGDAQVFCPTSMFNYECHAFWKSWLGSMRDDQNADGSIPHIIPDVLKRGGSPGWVDAATIIPWDIYVRTGDVDVLADNFQMMENLVAWYRDQATNNLIGNITAFGDWLQPHAKDRKGDTPSHFLATAFYAHSTELLAKSARVLEREEEAERYEKEAAAVKQAFAAHYFDAEGKLQNTPETQTAYLVALAFDLIPEDQRVGAGQHLVRLVEEADGHLRTGFLGTPFIASELDRLGYSDLAFSILFKETYPSWFYSINQGATTMWERWDSYSLKDGFSGEKMNSLNHYAYGAIGQWMVERIAGLSPDPAQPGYKHFFIRPVVGGALTSARAELETAYGKASSGWKKENGKLVIEAIVPPNTTATIIFPNGQKNETVVAGTYRFELNWND